jgi:hypothetical protein
MQAYDRLIQRLDAFIRRYYANQLLRGGLALLCCLLTFLLLAGLGEYFLYLPPTVKIGLISILVVLGGAALIFWVILPLTGFARIRKGILSYEQAALIAGRHFPEIGDKLLNVLQLRQGAVSVTTTDLLAASIDQKASQIAVVPLGRAIDLSKNKRFLPWLLPVLLLGLFLFVAAPSAFRDASSRLFQPTKAFERPAPFRFVIQNKGPLQVVRGADFELTVKATGSALPDAMAVAIGEDLRPMVKENGVFRYRFERVSDDVAFRLNAAGFYSQPYTLAVVPKPILKAFRVHLDYPDYTGRKDEVRASLGDLTVPIGTRVSWALATQFTDAALFQLGSGASVSLPQQLGYFGAQHRFLNDTTCTFTLRNKRSGASETQQFRVSVIQDAYPTVQVQEDRDTATGTQILITGTAGDDYGISRLVFQTAISSEGGRVVSQRAIPLPITGRNTASFHHYFDAATIALAPGQRLRYWVEVWDNDGIHGAKAARSEEHTLERAGGRKLDSLLAHNEKQVAAGLSSSSSQTEKLQEETKNLQTQLLQSEDASWESKQALQELSDRQEDLKMRLETAKKRFEESMKQREGRPYSEDAKEKAEALKEQMDRLLNKELAEQMKKLQDLMQKLSKDKAVQTLQQMEQENKLFNMDLQRLQELMKKLEQQLRLEDLASKVDKLAEQEQALKDQNDAGKQDPNALAKEQDALKKELEKTLANEMKEAQKQGESESKELEKGEQAGKQAGNAMEQSSQQMQQGQKSKASQAQQQAKQNLQQMAQALRQAAGGSSLQQINIDIRATRQILTNLVRLSFGEESLANSVRQTSPASQAYLNNQSEQARLYASSHVIRDSLFTLSKRVFALAATVNKETAGLEQSLSAATNALGDRRIPEAAQHQQYGMTHTNNLALMLNELLTHLLQQQAQAMQQGQGAAQSSGGGKSPKPGQGQGAGGQLSDIITGQQGLGSAMQQAAQTAQRRSGNKPGDGQKPGSQGQGQKPGEGGQRGGGQQGGGNQSGGGGGNGSSGEGSQDSENGDAEQIARLAQQQAAIRRQVQSLMSKLTGAGNPAAAKMLREAAEKMDRSESDLVNRRLTPEFVMRQSEILTRLLETDKAIREQEQDDKRSSRAGAQVARPLPPELQRALMQRQSLMQGYQTVPATLKPYYKAMVERYYQSIGRGQ